jgi:AcrR family transcriptional regulator
MSEMAQAPKPRRRRKEARPGEIIEAGLAEFGARGFEATRMEDVARRAGIAKGTVFRYFPGKEALFEAAIRSRVRPVFDQLGEILDRHEGPVAPLLVALVGRIHARLAGSDLSVLIRIIIAEGPRFPAILETYHRESIARGRAVLERVVARGVARGEFRAGALAELPMVLISPAVMAAIWQMTFGRLDPITPERFLAAHLELITHALRPDPGGAVPGATPSAG